MKRHSGWFASCDYREAQELSQTGTRNLLKNDPYREIAPWYDIEHDVFADDLPLIRQLVETIGDPLVELGCGSGRVLGSLADLEMRLTGVDISPTMLARARHRKGWGAGIELVLRDMAETGLDTGIFGIVLIALNSLLHATTSEHQREVMAEAFRLLDPRGSLYIDIPNPHAGAFEFSDHQVGVEGSWLLDDGSRITRYGARTGNRTAQTISNTVWYDSISNSGQLTRISTAFEQRYLYPSELLLMLEMVGFSEWQVYGSYDLDPYTDTSARLIVVAEKTASG